MVSNDSLLVSTVGAVKQYLILLGTDADERFAGDLQAVRSLELPQLICDLAPDEIMVAGPQFGHEVS